jgi:hypothetical protein
MMKLRSILKFLPPRRRRYSFPRHLPAMQDPVDLMTNAEQHDGDKGVPHIEKEQHHQSERCCDGGYTDYDVPDSHVAAVPLVNDLAANESVMAEAILWYRLMNVFAAFGCPIVEQPKAA